MDQLNTFLSLIAKTQGRDKVLRLIQYITLHSTEFNVATSTSNIYKQVRNTRKVLRFLRTLEYSKKIREQIPKLKDELGNTLLCANILSGILQNASTFLFFLSDHRVLLAQSKIIDQSNLVKHYPRSYMFYFLQNLFGVIRNILEIVVVFIQGKYNGQLIDMSSGSKILKQRIIDMIKCLLDIFVALFYWKKIMSAKKAGIIGTITSIISILQTLKMI